MYLIKAGQRIIYDSTDKDTYPVLSPSYDEELNGAGSLTFTVLPGHPYYDQMKEMQTFITAYKDDQEIFYGRILSIDKQIDGQMEVTCEGGLTFFMDSEMSKAKYNQTTEDFLQTVLNNHNSQMEAEKQFVLGDVTVKKATEIDPDTGKLKKYAFEISGYATTKSVLESLILGQFGGYLRIRSDEEGGHILDYLEDFGRVNTQPVRIGHNIVNKSDRVSGEDMFTILRPIYGKNSTIENLTQADVTLPNVTKDGEFLILDDMVQQYGRIIHTEAFDKVTKAKECLQKAEEFITRHGTQLPGSAEVGFVDFYHLNRQNFEERREEAAQIDYPHLVPGITFQMGNVNLLNRPVIPLQKVLDAGWGDDEEEEADPEDKATLYSVTYAGGLMKNLNPGAKYTSGIIHHNDDGTISIDGTFNSTRNYYFLTNDPAEKEKAIHLAAGTYTAHYEVLSGTLSATGSFGYRYWEGTSSTSHSVTAAFGTASVSHTFNTDVYILPVMSFEPNSTGTNAVIGFKLEQGSSPTSYDTEVDYPLDENLVFLVTPILSYGDVLSPSGLEDYFGKLIDNGAKTKTALINADKKSNGGKGLLIGVANMVGTPDNSYELAAEWAIALHDTQAYLYEGYIPDIKLGDIFTNIEEFDGINMTVGHITLDMENPGNDTMTLMNPEELESEGITSNTLTVVESKYQVKDAFRYHYIHEQVDEVEGYLQIWGPKFEVGTQAFETYTNRTFMTVVDDQDHPGEFKLQALRFGELDDDPSAPYAPTILMNVAGIRLSDQNKMVGEDGTEVTTRGALTVQADRITAEVTRASNAENTLTGRIDVEAGRIDGIAGDLIDVTDEVGDLTISYQTLTGSALWADRDELVALNGKFEIDQNGKLHVIEGSGLMVDRDGASFGVYDSQNLTAGIIVSKVNGGSVSINASKINLNGETVADAISAVNAEFDNLVSGSTVASMLSATAVVASRLSVGGSFEFSGSTIGLSSINWGMASGLTAKSFLGPESMSLGHYHNLNVDSGTGQVTIGAPTLSTSGSTFNIADTTFYQRAVSAAEQAGEATGYTAGYADGYPASVEVLGVSSPTKSGSIWTSTATAYVTTADGQATPSFPVTGMVVTGVYNAGANSIGITGSWNGATYTASTTGQTTAHSVSTTLDTVTVTLQGAPKSVTEQGESETFTLQGESEPITPIGRQISGDLIGTSHTVYDYSLATVKVADANSARYLYSGTTSVTVTLQGLPHSGTLYTKSGNTYTPYTGALYDAGKSATYTVVSGTQYTYYRASDVADTYYTKSSTSNTYYEKGTHLVGYQAGTEITRYKAGSSVTRYKAGSTNTYYRAGLEQTYYTIPL